MNFISSTQGADITTSRAVDQFIATYRQAILNSAISANCSSSEILFCEASVAIDKIIVSHQNLLNTLYTLIQGVAAAKPDNFKNLTEPFYRELYRHFDQFHSATSFYQLSMEFLLKISGSIVTETTDHFRQSGHNIPSIALIALGPAGRGEYSPYCPLQILIIHDEILPSENDSMQLFSETIHSKLERAGFAVDSLITPRNRDWRGSISDWKQRSLDALYSEENEELINLCRLVDQYPLFNDKNFSEEFKQILFSSILNSQPVMDNLIDRMSALSNGLGLMGGLKLEKRGDDKGRFRLLDHGLLPFSSALSALAIITKNLAIGSCQRISELLKRGELDVELAQRMLATWHSLHILRLWREQSYINLTLPESSLYLNPKELTDEQLKSLIEALESVAIIQNHVGIIFSGMRDKLS